MGIAEAMGVNVTGINGYTFKTTFWSDFTIAENFGGVSDIRDTFKRAFGEWKTDYIYLTELVMVLEWKMGDWSRRGNVRLSRLYEGFWNKAYDYAMENLKGEELTYYFRTTD